jgi:TrmH family RNA methyltransferase
MISSLSNPKVKHVRRLQSDRRFRSSQQQFVVEGTRWMGELLSKTLLLQNLFYTETWLSQTGHADLFAQMTASIYVVSDEVMTAMSSTETPPGVLATVAINPLPVPPRASLMLILDSITNPGNLGTMLRTATAAGVDAVLLTSGCVDIYNPKVVRGSMGALLRLPVHQLEWDEIARAVDRMRVWVAKVDGSKAYTAVDWRQSVALIVGNEAHGASKKANTLADGSVSIPMSAETESLNAAIAAGIILFEAARQRKLMDVSS